MRTVKVAPGIYRVEMSDEERRVKFRVRDSWAAAIHGKRHDLPITKVAREIFVQGDKNDEILPSRPRK